MNILRVHADVSLLNGPEAPILGSTTVHRSEVLAAAVHFVSRESPAFVTIRRPFGKGAGNTRRPERFPPEPEHLAHRSLSDQMKSSPEGEGVYGKSPEGGHQENSVCLRLGVEFDITDTRSDTMPEYSSYRDRVKTFCLSPKKKPVKIPKQGRPSDSQ